MFEQVRILFQDNASATSTNWTQNELAQGYDVFETACHNIFSPQCEQLTP